jgi:uncharacterized circularly permuted ATP-grasp superfamily protein
MVVMAAEAWNALLRPEVELQPAFWDELSGRMRAARLTFGDRVHCPFLRPLFLAPEDVARVTRVAEGLWRIGERIAAAALSRPDLLDALALTDDERSLVAIDPGYDVASTASRLDGFLLPDSLAFAEYNAESPAGLGYTGRLAALFDALPVMERFRQQFSVSTYDPAPALLEALLASYHDWGGTSERPTMLIVDYRGVPTWSEFEILAARFEALGVPTVVADPRDVAFDGGALVAADRRIDLVYRRVLIGDIVAQPEECAPLVDACRLGAVCMANTFRCKIPHKKAFFAVLTDDDHAGLFTPDEHALIRAHVPWTRVLAATRTIVAGRSIDLLEHVRRHRDEFVIKPNDEYGGTGVMLGWEASEAAWSAALERAVSGTEGAWVVQRRIPVRREVFPMVESPHRVELREMLVDLAPYLFRGRVAGFLTRLSSTGLANVTSGGGQVPSFVVSPLGS